jgi:hypothetical protein
VVQYNGTYYIYKGTDGATVSSWNSANWESFGAQFSSVATDLLLAINANVGGWIFKNERLESQSGGAYLDGRTGNVSITGKFSSAANGRRVVIDPATAKISAYSNTGDPVYELSYDNQITGGYEYPTMELKTKFGTGNSSTSVVITPFSISVGGALLFSSIGGLNTSMVTLKNIPTSGGGYSAGTVYRDGNTLKIV